jgi:REP element-mobilizing transposase RayT
MKTYNAIIVHTIFHTLKKQPTLKIKDRQQLNTYLINILRKNNCIVFQVNSVKNHVHLAFSFPTSARIDHIVQELKSCSSKYIKNELQNQDFIKWERGFSIFSHHKNNLQKLINYIKNQDQHHNIKP